MVLFNSECLQTERTKLFHGFFLFSVFFIIFITENSPSARRLNHQAMNLAGLFLEVFQGSYICMLEILHALIIVISSFHEIALKSNNIKISSLKSDSSFLE